MGKADGDWDRVITRIELKNFMSHVHTVIEPARGLTVIAGPNNCGKSAIVTAMQILCYNDDSTYVTRHGEKECSIKVETSTGHEVEWIRTKNKSTKYIIDGKQFDRLGRGKVPKELVDALQIQRVSCEGKEFDVHFGEQKSPVFLLNDTPRAAAQFFASSSDAVKLIEMQSLHKQNVRDRKSEKRRLTQELSKVDEQLEALLPLKPLDEELAGIEKQYQALQEAEVELESLHNLTMAIVEKQTQQRQLDAKLNSLQQLAVPPELACTLNLERHVDSLESCDQALNQTNRIVEALARLEVPPSLVDTDQLESLIQETEKAKRDSSRVENQLDCLEPLPVTPIIPDDNPLAELIKRLDLHSNQEAKLAASLDAISKLAQPPLQESLEGVSTWISNASAKSKEEMELAQTIEEIENGIKSAASEIEDWAKSNPTCPTCGSDIKPEDILDPNGAHRHE